MSWGTELWDQFDNLEKHTQWGIDILEKYIKFVKERTEIELSYAKQLRNLSKKYQPKKNSKEEEEYKYTACKAFLSTLNEMNDYAGQHEVISENMTSQITACSCGSASPSACVRHGCFSPAAPHGGCPLYSAPFPPRPPRQLGMCPVSLLLPGSQSTCSSPGHSLHISHCAFVNCHPWFPGD